jgi:hypothetical protein
MFSFMARGGIELGLHIEHLLADADRLLGKQMNQAACSLDRPGSFWPLTCPLQQPVDLSDRRVHSNLAQPLLARVEREERRHRPTSRRRGGSLTNGVAHQRGNRPFWVCWARDELVASPAQVLVEQRVDHIGGVGSTAIASIEISKPRGNRTLAGAERAGGGFGMCRA